ARPRRRDHRVGGEARLADARGGEGAGPRRGRPHRRRGEGRHRSAGGARERSAARAGGAARRRRRREDPAPRDRREGPRRAAQPAQARDLMAEIATIARPYAEAVFGLADKAGAAGNWLSTLSTMAQVAGNPEMQACIGNPNVGAKALYDLFI